ncbi:MAG: CAP domain-containing protein [Alsobacter sp.]
MTNRQRRFSLLIAFATALAALQPAGAATQQGKARPAPRASAAAQAVSAFRLSNGLGPVADDAALMRAAQQQADAMAAATTMSHTVAGDLSSRLGKAGIRAGAAAENVAVGQRSLAEVMEDWKASSGHRRNMLMTGATRVAVAQRKGADGKIYWAMLLAAPEPAPRQAGAPAGFTWGAPIPFFP